GFFDGIPRSFSEAAKLDGASNITIFFKIMLPLSIPALTFIALLSFMTPWMDYAIARFVLSSGANQTVALGLYNMVVRYSRDEFTMFAAGSVIIAIPITVLYAFLQKYLIHGLSEGAAKY
ncbi:MAG: ABC transporter permease subunit, partial [Bacillota bacterium]